MNYNLNHVSTFSEEQLETLMTEIEKNPLIVVPHYLLKSQIMEYIPIQYKRQDILNNFLDGIDEVYYSKIKYIIGDKKIEYCFNYPNYYTRLFHKKSGVGFKAKKIVHEQNFKKER